MAAEDRIVLARGRLRLTLNPAIGGSIEGLEWIDGERSRPIMRKSPEPLTNVLEAASFPLVPYVNRIRGGRFNFRGKEVVIAPNMAGDPSPLHGQGWLNPWQLESASETRAVLTFVHEPGEWPWAYEAHQEFAVDEAGFTVALSCRNICDEQMPCGLGQHPYFQCGPETRIDTEVSHVWTIDEHVLPVAKVPAEGRYDLRDRLVCGQGLDHGFGGWGGEALLSDPVWLYRVRLSSTDAQFFQLYSPPAGGIFVAEPVSHANAALNASEYEWPDLGMRVLDPGETMSFAMRLDVTPVEP